MTTGKSIPTTRMTRRALAATGLLVAAAVAALALALTQRAEAQVAPIQPEILVPHSQFTDDVAVQVRDKPDGRSTSVVNLRDASNIAVGRFTVQPGATFPWHSHPGAGLVAVVEGSLTFVYSDDCVERTYATGEAFADTDIVHTAYNPGDTETVVIATFLGVPDGEPLSTAVGAAEAEALNARCGLDAPVPGGGSHSH
jgi:quercetin dioxygenase-like cupin family protein